MRSCRLVRITSVTLLLLLLLGCNREAEQRRQVLEGVGTLRERFNRGACEEIQSQTMEPDNAALKEKWVQGCEQMRETLGVWQSSSYLTPDFTSKNTKPLTVFVWGGSLVSKRRPHRDLRL